MIMSFFRPRFTITKEAVDPQSFLNSANEAIISFDKAEIRYGVAELGFSAGFLAQAVDVLRQDIVKEIDFDMLVKEAVDVVNLYDSANQFNCLGVLGEEGEELRKAINGLRARLNGKVKLTING